MKREIDKDGIAGSEAGNKRTERGKLMQMKSKKEREELREETEN